MRYKRILTIQDISCVGKCSMTVALPVLSVCGHETCVLPTALLSTHTGGFGKPSVVRFEEKFEPIRQHWQENGIQFDAVLVGYLGSVDAVRAVETILDRHLAPDGVVIVDPAMADHGKLYSGLTEAYAREMIGLCRRADVVLPNLTEAAMMAGSPLPETAEDAAGLLRALDQEQIVLTGVGFEPGKTGVLVRQGGSCRYYGHPRLNRDHHGTGDLFAAALTGAWMSGRELYDAAGIAADFVCRCIEATPADADKRYGVRFEPVLPELVRRLTENA